MRRGTWVICFYPQKWRLRYEEEMVALLEQHTITPATFFDLLLGALDARLDPLYRSEKPLFLFKNERMIATTFLCAYALFLFAMYNWHHYIPLSLSLSPFYLQMDMLSAQSSASLPSSMSSDSLLATSDLVMQATLIASNLFFIALHVKQAKSAERKRLVLPSLLCLFVLFLLPLLPLLGVPTSTVTLTNPAGTLFSVEVRPLDQIVGLYQWSFRLLWPLSGLLISSLFIAIIKFRTVMNATRKHWLLLALLFYLALPIGRMLWLNNSVQIPSTVLPISSVVLGTILTYFPPFAGLATMVLAVANNDGSKHFWHVALLPATVLSLVMLAKILTTLTMLPFIWRSMTYSLSSWDASLSMVTLSTMLFLMFASGSLVLIALVRGFVASQMVETHAQVADTPQTFPQSAHMI